MREARRERASDRERRHERGRQAGLALHESASRSRVAAGSAWRSNARKIALTEQRRAKRARSKKRFAFWAEVAAQIENGNGAAKEVTGKGEHPKIRPSRCAPHLREPV